METKSNGATTTKQEPLECRWCGWQRVRDLHPVVGPGWHIMVACKNRFACWLRERDLEEYLDAHGQTVAGK